MSYQELLSKRAEKIAGKNDINPETLLNSNPKRKAISRKSCNFSQKRILPLMILTLLCMIISTLALNPNKSRQLESFSSYITLTIEKRELKLFWALLLNYVLMKYM